MPMIEIGAYFNTSTLLNEMTWAVDAAVNSKNAEKVQQIQAELESIVMERTVGVPLSLTFAVVGRPELTNASSKQSSVLGYDSSNTCVVENVLGLIAICKFFGLKTFLFSSRLSVKETSQRSELRQRLAMESVEVRIVFDNERGMDAKHVIELFKNSNIFNSPLSLPHLSNGKNLLPDDYFPLKPFIEELIQDTDIESYGGVNFNSKHVKVSEHYITTQYILFKLIVGAVAGMGTQEYSKMSKDVTLPDGTQLTLALSEGYMDKISSFMSAWLESLKDSFVKDRSGYHLSPQIWQALGLTIHRLASNGASLSELKAAGQALGTLDYSKSAAHWDNCSVMELDVKGRIYKNSATSTRLFRVGLFEHFVKFLAR
ncbi:hypothetical protein [Vibrio pomeroyi]|uniref:hypothetical protein n=1 Tax=Vibrio pomeroyi TaxID=198832 RepID=UPI0036F408E8